MAEKDLQITISQTPQERPDARLVMFDKESNRVIERQKRKG
jgi:hypothetical protein